MAITVYTRHDSQIAILQQAAWGTATVDAAAMEELPNVQAVIDPDVKIRRPDRSCSSIDGASRQKDLRDITNDSIGSSPKITLSGDARKSDLALYLYGVMQNVTEDAATPFDKIFTFPATQPDLTIIDSIDDAGIIFGVAAGHPVASTSQLITDAIIGQLDLSCEPGAGDDRLQYSAQFLGRGAVDPTFNPTIANWLRAVETFFYFQNINGLKTNFGGVVSQDINSFTLSIMNNATPIGVDVDATTGLFRTFALGPYTAKMTVRIPYSTAAATLLGNLYTGADGTVQLWWGTEAPAADGDLKIELNAVVDGAPHELDYKGVHVIAFSFEAVTDKANSADDSLTITLCDANERTWVSA